MDLGRLQPSTFFSATRPIPVEAVWAVASDPRALPPLSSELQSVRLIGDSPVGLRSQFEGDQRRGEREWTTISTVTAYIELVHFEWTVGDLDDPVSTWSFIIDANDAGTTVSHKVVLRGGPSPLSTYVADHPEEASDIICERLDALRARMATTVAGIFALAEKA